MAFLNVNTPLKNLKTGDYFYPLTNLDQIITGNNRLSAFLSEDNSNHNLLNLSNIGNINGNITINGNISFTNSGTGFRGINYGTMGDNDQWRIGGAATEPNAGYMEIATADDGDEPIYVRQYTGVFTTLTRTATLLDGSGNTSFPGRIFADSYSTNWGYINGKATNGGINQILIGDDAWLGDCNIGGTLGIKSCSGGEAGISFYGNDGSGKGRIYYNGTGHSTVGLYGAVWNDYAEFRKSDTQEPGYVIAPAEDGISYKTSVRMQPGAKIISDTFGFAVGECDDAKTPVGLMGRVLAYTYQNPSNYKIGDVVCAAPNGTVDIMTREEIMQYPDRIIGIVNEIPKYKTWKSILTHSNNEQTIREIEVKNRIWIDIK